MNADTLALAVMDDDGWGCAITAAPPANDEPRYVAHFTPEAWIRDNATEVDPEGPQEWDCTGYARQNLEYLDRTARRRHEDLNDDLFGVTDNDDVFMDDPAAPEWVRSWQGPFTIRIRYAREGE
jgi:hypothetical protein